MGEEARKGTPGRVLDHTRVTFSAGVAAPAGRPAPLAPDQVTAPRTAAPTNAVMDLTRLDVLIRRPPRPCPPVPKHRRAAHRRRGPGCRPGPVASVGAAPGTPAGPRGPPFRHCA